MSWKNLLGRMMKNLWPPPVIALSIVAAALSAISNGFAQGKEVVIAYQDMLVPWRYAQETHEVEKQTGFKVSYRKFGGGADVIRAMASGSVQIGEAGSSPIASALSQGLNIELFWILDNINDAEALVVRNGSNIHSIADLRGKKIGVPFVSTSHFHTLVALKEAGINPREVQILNLRPPEIAAAWHRGDIDATYIWNPVLAEVKKTGQTLITSGKIADTTGEATFDGFVVNKEFAKANSSFLIDFVRILAAADQSYRANKDRWTADSPQVKAVADVTGANAQDVPEGIALYSFPTVEEQLSTRWLGGGIDSGAAKSLASTAAFLKGQGAIQTLLSDYSIGVDAQWVSQVR
jgi:taurine transport system substrate-binding protein